MYSDKIKTIFVLGLTIISLIFAYSKIIELCHVRQQKAHYINQNKSIHNLCRDINFIKNNYLKSGDKIVQKSSDIKKTIGDIAKKLSIQKVFIKKNTNNNIAHGYFKSEKVQIRISISQETQLYKFVQDLYSELNGIVQFETINVTQHNGKELLADITTNIFSINNDSIRKQIHIRQGNSTKSMSSLNLFNMDTKKQHKLFCVIDDAKAYIDKKWFIAGDYINDTKIIKIDKRGIEVSSEDVTNKYIAVGDTW